MTGLFNSRRARARIYQALVLLLVLAATLSLLLVAHQNLLQQGIATGFGFLQRSTGWPINFALIEVSDRSSYGRMLTAGLLNTLLVGFLGIALATVVGVIIGILRISTNAVLDLMGTIFVEVFRNVPLILQGFFWYAVLTHLPSPRQAISLAEVGFLSNRGLFLPALDMSSGDILVLLAGCVAAICIVRRALRQDPRRGRFLWLWAVAAITALLALLLWTGRTPGEPLLSVPVLRGLRFTGGIEIKPEFSALLIAMTFFGGAYIGEIVRGGFLSVERGKIEAARALGLNGYQINRLIRVPLALRAMLPSLANQYVWLMKATTIGIAIGYPDYFMVISTSINQSGQTIELMALLMGGFLLINYSIGFVMNRLNARLAIKGPGS